MQLCLTLASLTSDSPRGFPPVYPLFAWLCSLFERILHWTHCSFTDRQQQVFSIDVINLLVNRLDSIIPLLERILITKVHKKRVSLLLVIDDILEIHFLWILIPTHVVCSFPPFKKSMPFGNSMVHSSLYVQEKPSFIRIHKIRSLRNNTAIANNGNTQILTQL